MSNTLAPPNKVEAKQLVTERLTIVPLYHIQAKAILNYHLKNRAFLKATYPAPVEGFFTEDYWQRKLWLARQEWDNQKAALFVLKITESPLPETIIGTVNFNQIVRGVLQSCFLGYSLDEDYQAQGYMTEALESLIDHIFRDWRLHRIQANYLTSNKSSARVLEKLNFEKEGLAKRYLKIDGRWQDHILTARINDNPDL